MKYRFFYFSDLMKYFINFFDQSHELKFESHVYEILRSENGFPHLRKFGEDNLLSVNYLAMDLLGPTVEDLFNFCDKSFSLKTILMLIEQLLCRLECIHSKGIIHR